MRLPVLLLISPLLTAGCGRAVQDYAVLAPSSRAAALDDSKVIVEGRVTQSRSYDTATFADYLFFFIPHGPNTANRRGDMSITIERVLRGDPRSATIELHDYRPLKPSEFERFPDSFGMFHQQLFVRLGYDGRRGNRLKDLRIVPLRVTPEFEASLLRAKQRRSQTSPSSRPSSGPKQQTIHDDLPKPAHQVG